MKHIYTLFVFVFLPFLIYSQNSIKEVDFLTLHRNGINAAGPVLLCTDDINNKIYVANTLSSSVSVINGITDEVVNIPVEGRTLQHLKNSAIAYNEETGFVYLIGTNNFFIVDTRNEVSKTIPTSKQFECITVDEKSGNVFLTGRESSKIGFYNAKTKDFILMNWLSHEENLENLNQTPPPAIRKIIATNDSSQNIMAVDGFTSTLYLIDGSNCNIISERKLPLGNNDGRWHLAGYDKKYKQLYLATETKKRQISNVAKIDVFGSDDLVVELPKGFSEPVGIIYHPKLQEVYVPYDNNAFVHAVSFKDSGEVTAIPIPAYGNDGSAIDIENDILYIASWAHGEVEVIDLIVKKFVKKIEHLGIIPHMFAFTFNKANGCLYFPVGATAVNGNFGAAVTKLNPNDKKIKKIYTGWAPIELIEMPKRHSVLVFNNQSEFAEVKFNGTFKTHTLPFDFPVCAIRSPENNVYLSYGPHQSYWPTVYIWDAKNGILTLDENELDYYDRRIPRQAMQMALDENGVLYLQQNNWGREAIIINKIDDEVRYYEIGKRITLEDTVQRETTQRVMKYDEKEHLIYLVKIAEKDDEPSVLHIIDPDSNRTIKKYDIGKSTTALEFDNNYIYCANYGSNSVSMIDKRTDEITTLMTGRGTLRLCKCDSKIWALNEQSNDIMEVKEPDINSGMFGFDIPYGNSPDNIFCFKDKLIITTFDKNHFYIVQFDPVTKKFALIHKHIYPYGEISYNSGNAAFYVKGVYGDVIFSLTKAITDQYGNFWITDFLAGKAYIISGL
jgi:YVTN family beta-propeller protein